MLATDINHVLAQDIKSSTILVAGDFNSDVNKPAEYPDTRASPEKITNCTFIDLWPMFGDGSSGATESTSRNLFRAALKPDQRKEVRFDRVLVGQKAPKTLKFCDAKITLLGDAQVGTARSQDGITSIPLFPSDHFGLSVFLS